MDPHGSDAHFCIAVADQRNNRINVRAGQSADLRERVERRGLELRTARGRKPIKQSLAVPFGGLARLAQALRRGDSHIVTRVVEKWSNRADVFRGRLRRENDGETAARMFGSGSLAYFSTTTTCGFACTPSRAKN